MRVYLSVLLFVVVLCVCSQYVVGFGHTYTERARVPVVANNVGPYHNPAETYEYYSLPFCAPKDFQRHKNNLGQVIAGDRRTDTLYDVRYQGMS
jgi:transmembrane 9 superfamily member 1